MIKSWIARTKPRYWPLTLLVKQAALIFVYAWVVGWKPRAFVKWLSQWGYLRHAGAGACEIGCFGPSPHVVWEATRDCNLRCTHCHASGGEAVGDELTTAEAKNLLYQVRASNTRSFVFSGGEPFLREDLFELIAYARGIGLNLFIATNGVLITPEITRRLKEYDVAVVIGLDAMKAEIHERIRGVPGCFEATMAGIRNSAQAGLYFHLNIVAIKINLHEVARIIDFGNSIGAFSYFIYNFVAMGRGEQVQEYKLSQQETRRLLEIIRDNQRKSSTIIIPVAFPEYFAYLVEKRGIKSRKMVNFLSRFLGGCQVGRGMTYIKPNGDVWACPFLPARVGNIREASLVEIQRGLASFRLEQNYPECQLCLFQTLCGGCKARMSMGLHCSLTET